MRRTGEVSHVWGVESGDSSVLMPRIEYKNNTENNTENARRRARIAGIEEEEGAIEYI